MWGSDAPPPATTTKPARAPCHECIDDDSTLPKRRKGGSQEPPPRNIPQVPAPWACPLVPTQHTGRLSTQLTHPWGCGCASRSGCRQAWASPGSAAVSAMGAAPANPGCLPLHARYCPALMTAASRASWLEPPPLLLLSLLEEGLPCPRLCRTAGSAPSRCMCREQLAECRMEEACSDDCNVGRR